MPDNAILVTTDVVGFCPSIPHKAGSRALRKALEKQNKKSIPTNDLVKKEEIVLKNNFFEFNSKIKHQVSGTAIVTKFAQAYAFLFMDKFETKNLTTATPGIVQIHRDIFFIWTDGEEKLNTFLRILNKLDP